MRFLQLIRPVFKWSLLATLAALMMPAAVSAQSNDVQTAWRLLDYVAVDYSGAVEEGRVKSTTEFAEMNEFAAAVTARLRALPSKPEQRALIQGAVNLESVIAHKGQAKQVAAIAHGIAADLLRAYPVSLAPDKAPDVTLGAALFQQNCSSCHGTTGNGHGPDAAKLSTPPIAFTDLTRARQRSVFALYQVVTQGIDGTAMRSFSDFAADERWGVAFLAGSLAFTDAQAREGERLWKTDAALRQKIPDLKTLVGLTPVALAASIGQDKSDAVFAFLRRHPDQVSHQTTGSLALARAKLAESIEAARRGDAHAAKELALSAYLDGFEPMEPTLTARDATLMGRIEGAMGDFRAAIEHRASPEDLSDRLAILDALFDDAEVVLAPDAASQTSTFVGAFTILLREGIEALLIIVAMIAFLRKAERAESVRYVHGGWIGALVAGAITWAVATYAIGISGASRELTEGFGSLFAAIVLLSVGIWMHGKAQADQWQRYIREKMSRALSGGSGWFLFGLAFLVVYREVFETILFYAALSAQGNNAMLLAGAGSAIALLAAIAWMMLRYSRRLPITQFFRYSSWLMAALTVVLAGKGIAALQEAGIISMAPLAGVPRISMLGLFPTWQSVLAQILMVTAVAIGFYWNGRKQLTAETPGPA